VPSIVPASKPHAPPRHVIPHTNRAVVILASRAIYNLQSTI